MKKNLTSDENFNQEQTKYFSSSVLRTDNEFYRESDDLKTDVIRVKYIKKKSSERWDIYNNSSIIFSLSGERFTKSEREFFKTVQGINFIIDSHKKGFDSVNSYKVELKRILKNLKKAKK